MDKIEVAVLGDYGESRPECDGRRGSNCAKWGRKNDSCKPSNLAWFNETLSQYELPTVCRRSSIFGNDYYALTDADIAALKAGKVLGSVDEYGFFIAYKEG